MSRTIEYRFEGNERPLRSSISNLQRAIGGLDSDFQDTGREVERAFDDSPMDSFLGSFRTLQGTLSNFGFDLGLEGLMDFDLGALTSQFEALVDLDVGRAVRDAGFGAQEAEGGFSALKLAAANAAGSLLGLRGGTTNFVQSIKDLGPLNALNWKLFELTDKPGGIAKQFGHLASKLLGFGSTASKVAAILGALVTALAAVATVVTALGVRQAITSTRLWVTEIENLSAASGSTVPEIQALQGAFRDLGIDTQEVAEILQDVQTEISEALSEGGDKARSFRRLGLSMQEMENNSAAQTMQQLIQNINGMSEAQARYRLNQTLGEEATRKLMATRRMSAQQLRDLNQAMEGNASLSEEQRGGLLALQQQVSDLSSKWNNLKRTFGATFTDTARGVVWITEKIVDMGQALVDATGYVNDFFQSGFQAVGLFEDDEVVPEEGPGGRPTRAVDRRRAQSLREYRRELEMLQERLDFGVIDDQTFKEDKLAALVSHFERLQEISADFPNIEFPLEMDLIADQIRALQDELDDAGVSVGVEFEFESRSVFGDDFEPIEAADLQVDRSMRGDLSGPLATTGYTGMIEELNRRFGNGTTSLSLYRDQLKEVQARLEAVESPTVSQYRNLQKVNDQLRDTSMSFQVFSQTAQTAAFQFGQDFLGVFERLFQGPKDLTDEEKAELRQRERDLNQSLAERRITQNEYTAQMAEITRKRTNEMKGEITSFGDVFKEVFKSIGKFVGSIMKQIVTQITAALAQAAALKAISSVFSFGLGSFGSIFGGVLGVGGGNLVLGSQNPVRIQGQTRISGQDLVVSYGRSQQTLSRL